MPSMKTVGTIHNISGSLLQNSNFYIKLKVIQFKWYSPGLVTCHPVLGMEVYTKVSKPEVLSQMRIMWMLLRGSWDGLRLLLLLNMEVKSPGSSEKDWPVFHSSSAPISHNMHPWTKIFDSMQSKVNQGMEWSLRITCALPVNIQPASKELTHTIKQ